LGPFLIRALYNALTVSEKVEGLGHTAPTMDDEESIPRGSQDDAYLVRLAVETRAILVTTDGALRDDLESSGILSRYDLTVVSPEDATGLL
jgi:rRNA-processing protein FCF1